MKFGLVPVVEAAGAILAHSVMLKGVKFAKGRVLTMADCERLTSSGLSEFTVARLEPGEIGEDEAAERLAGALVPEPKIAGLSLTAAHTGRVNLKATRPGVFMVDRNALLRVNAVDHAITVATLSPMTRVAVGQMVGTVKIITYGVDGMSLDQAALHAVAAVSVRAVSIATATLILTETPGLDDKLIRKGRSAVAARMKALGIELVGVESVPHRSEAVANAISSANGEMILILTGAATSDPHDVAPEAVRLAGGAVDRFGMPVDPGNLLFLGRIGKKPVVGLPGCARSPALNGADWVLERVACGLTPSALDFAAMGVGGLLKEVPLRGRMRDEDSSSG
jgi:molybdenum cofactor cytidylyltransferase